jgi:hypothetical protein
VGLWHVYPGGFAFPFDVCPLHYVFPGYFWSPLSLPPFVMFSPCLPLSLGEINRTGSYNKRENNVGYVENGRVRVSSPFPTPPHPFCIKKLNT